jgi:uncharacterized protein
VYPLRGIPCVATGWALRMSFELCMETRDEKSRIQVRRFAGPALHAAVLDRPIRVAHLTDLHVGRVTPMYVQERAVQLTNAARPDIVVITGDFVCHSQSWLEDLRSVVSAFDAPVFAVLGNHDHWSGAQAVRKTLLRAGVEVLDNAHTTITIGHQRLQVIGVDDAYTGHADRRKAVAGLRRDLPALGLSHIAEEADGFWRAGVPLVLSGHTHAGQITVARLDTAKNQPKILVDREEEWDGTSRHPSAS